MRKYVMVAAVFIFLAFFIHTTTAATCSSYPSESACESSNCFWCERCSGKEANSYIADRCIDSSLNCTYSCSTVCGAQCQTDNNCATNLTDTDCYYAGRCASCNCTYQQTTCPKPGTSLNGVCYYGTRSCTSTGCSVSSCSLRESEVCDPEKGCVSCGRDDCGAQGEFIGDYKCVGDELFAKKIIYFCSATSCNYTKSEIFVERCRNGCNADRCRDELCNIEGRLVDCNEFDGYYGGRYCVGKDVYATYQDYKCGTNECVFTTQSVKQETCGECENGRCVETKEEMIVFIPPAANATTPQGQETETALQRLSTHPGSRLYSGFFFGKNEINIDVQKGRSGYVNFTVARANRLGALVVESGRGGLFNRIAAPNTYTIRFQDIDNVKFSASTSGWIFFMPAVYDVRNIVVFYED